MGQPPEKPTVEQVRKLVDQLTPEEREQILDELKMASLRRSIQIGIEQAERGEMIDGDEVFRQMRARNAALREKGNP
ncbi:MAG: hypothetical protein ACRD3W_13390 [Terriglobales bacterium]